MQQDGLSRLRQDLRAPADRIVAGAALLLEREADNLSPDLTSYLKKVHLAGTNLTTLIDQVATLLESDASKEALRSARHELRTPLTHVMGYAGLLQEEAEAAGFEQMSPELARILKAGQEILDLIDQRLRPRSTSEGVRS